MSISRDEKIPLDDAQQIVDALEECGGNIQFTIHPDAGHDDEYPVYIEPDLFYWMLSHSFK